MLSIHRALGFLCLPRVGSFLFLSEILGFSPWLTANFKNMNNQPFLTFLNTLGIFLSFPFPFLFLKTEMEIDPVYVLLFCEILFWTFPVFLRFFCLYAHIKPFMTRKGQRASSLTLMGWSRPPPYKMLINIKSPIFTLFFV